jgi:uncharacterized membrane protein YbhN (UPF0104 family)
VSDPTPTAPPSSWRRWASYAFLALCLVAATWAVASQGEELADALSDLAWPTVVLSFLCGVAATLAGFMSWQSAVTDGGVQLPLRVGLRIYAVGQVGKYLPGAVWPVLTQTQLGSRHGASRIRMASGALLALAISVCACLVVGVLLLPFAGGEAADRYWWAPFVAVPMVVALFPPVLNRLLGIAAKVLRQGPFESGYSGLGIVRAVAWSVVASVFFGFQLYALAWNNGEHGVRLYLLCVCAYALAAGIGVLVVFAPAGAGAREAVITAVLAPVLGVPFSLAIALVSRVLLIIVDGLIALTQLRGLRATPTRPDEPARPHG